MTDTIIKGTGNSRSLKTVPNAMALYGNFPEMMQALIDGTFPIDIGPLNPLGVDVIGTPLDKAHLISMETGTVISTIVQYRAYYTIYCNLTPEVVFIKSRAYPVPPEYPLYFPVMIRNGDPDNHNPTTIYSVRSPSGQTVYISLEAEFENNKVVISGTNVGNVDYLVIGH